MTESNSIRNVSDTALRVAFYRAMESERIPAAAMHDERLFRLSSYLQRAH